MRLDKIFMSSAYACVAVALITIAVTKGRDKDVVDVEKEDCIDVATKLGDACQYWSDTFDKCYVGKCVTLAEGSLGCKSCQKGMDIVGIILLFSGVFFILCFSYALLDGLIGE